MYKSGKVFRIFKNVGYPPPHHLIEIAPSMGKATRMSKLAQKNQITTLDLGTGVSSLGLAAFQLNKITSLVLPSSVQTMGNGVFQDNLIKNITIKSGVGNVGINAFHNNPVISVTSEGVIPPTLASSAFTTRNTIDLYIPSGTKAAYVTNSRSEN